MNPPIFPIYADTSVFGGVFDDGFDQASQVFFQQVKEGRFQLVISPIVQGGFTTSQSLFRCWYCNA